MAVRSQALTISYTAWNTTLAAPQTGDAANHTLTWIKDGVEAPASGTVTELSDGEYALTLSAAETDCNAGTLHGTSSTSGVVLVPVRLSFVQLPTAAPGTAGGLPTADADNAIAVASLSAAAISAIWDEPQAAHTTAGTFGFFLDAAISALATGSAGSGTGSVGDYLQDLLATRDNVAAQLAEITANPKPSYSVDDQWVDWDTHFKALSDRLEKLNQAIQAAQPFEIQTTGYTQ